METNQRYVTTVELNSQQAQEHLRELEKKVKEFKKKKDEALAQGMKFVDDKELKKATRELNNWKAQIQGVKGVLDNINDVSLEDLQKTLRKLNRQKARYLPDEHEYKQAEYGIQQLEARIKELKEGFREARQESDRMRDNLSNLSSVMGNLKGASLNQLTQAQKYLEEQMAKASPQSTTYNIAASQLKEVKGRIQEIKAEQQLIIHQIDRYDQEIKQSSKDMETVKRETELVKRTLNNISSANVRDLEYSIKIINEQLRETPRGTAAFDQLQEKAKLLRTELERVRYEGAAQQSWLNRTADFFNKIQGAAIAAVGAITGLTFTIRRCVEAFASMDQEMENVRKYTGQTSEQVHAMNEEFKKLDTRTARERLNQLAGDAGRLGITSQEAVMDFVDAADKINVALGDDLGENAVKNIGKLAMSFGTDKEMGLRGAMLATGSAVNELAQNSSAAANYLIDFTARVAGFGKQVGLTQSQLMGFAAVMDENMLQDEMAATAFGQLLVKMTTNLDTFANITGMKVEEYRKLVTENINGAVLAVAKALQGRDMEEMGKIFDDMHLNGQRAIGVLATLGQKVDDVAERQRIANDAFNEGTSVIEEFNVQNNTVQAGLDKAKKQFHDLSVELGERLLPIARYTISTGAAIVKTLSALIKFVTEYAATLISLTATITVILALEYKEVAVKKLKVFWNDKVIASTKKLWALLLAHPYAAIAAAIAVVIGLMIDFNRKTDGTSEALKKLNKNREDAKKKAAEEASSLEILIKASKNEKLSLDERLKAIDKLEKQIPGYITQLDRETGKYKENKKALDDYIRSLEKRYELEGAKDMLADIGKEIAEATVKVNQAKAAADRAGNAGSGTTYTTSWGSVGNTTSDLKDRTRKDLDDANRVLQEKLKERQKILDAYGQDLQKDAVKNEEKETEIVQQTPTPYKSGKDAKKEEAERKKQEAAMAKELRERNKAIKAEIEKEMALTTASYARGEIDYRTYVKKIDAIQMDGFNKRMAIYSEESDEYKKLLNDREQYALKSQEKQDRLNVKAVQREHNLTVAQLENQQWDNEDAYYEARYQAEMQFLMKMRDLYRKGSEERAEIEEEIEDTEQIHKLERQKRYQEQLLNIQTEYLNMANEQQLKIALNGLEELHKQGLISEEQYQQARIAIQAKYSKVQTSSDKAASLGSSMLKNASDAATEELDNSGQTPFVGTIKQYAATMEKLKEMYADDEENHAAYLAAKHQATSEFITKIGEEFQMMYSMINGIMTAASSLYSAQAELETAEVKKKYEKQIEAAGNNQKKVKKLQEKQAKEEAAIKNKYNKKAARIQIAQALASTAMNAIQAYGSVLQPAQPWTYPLAIIAAAAATAAGMLQVAAIRKQAQAQEAGYYEGGYTGGKRYRKEAGVVHEGEFVANHSAVNNPAVRPMLDFIDKAQKNNTVGSLTKEDVSRQMGQGSAYVVPVVNVNSDNSDISEPISKFNENNEKLIDVLKDGIPCYMDTEHAYKSLKHLEQLKNNAK